MKYALNKVEIEEDMSRKNIQYVNPSNTNKKINVELPNFEKKSNASNKSDNDDVSEDFKFTQDPENNSIVCNKSEAISEVFEFAQNSETKSIPYEVSEFDSYDEKSSNLISDDIISSRARKSKETAISEKIKPDIITFNKETQYVNIKLDDDKKDIKIQEGDYEEIIEEIKEKEEHKTLKTKNLEIMKNSEENKVKN